MRQVSDEKLLEGIRSRNNQTLKKIYTDYYPMVRKFILRNNGNREDARDIFQDAVMIIFEKAQKRNFVLECSMKTFLYSICRNMWLQRLERRRKVMNVKDIENCCAEEDLAIYEDTEVMRKLLYQKHFMNLSARCREILTLYLKQLSFDEITEQMGLGNKQYAIKKKYECIRTLIRRIHDDPEYKRL